MKRHKSFTHLTESDRDRIHAMYMHGLSQKDISHVLGVNPGTISRELARYGKTTWRYNAARAQRDAEKKRSNSKRPGMKVEDHPELKKYIIRELKRLRSPDEIAGRLKTLDVIPRVGKNAIYKWLYSEDGRSYSKYLCTRRSRSKRQSHLSKRTLIPNRISLNERPDTKGLIHTERDLFVSPTKLHAKSVGLLIVAKDSKLFSGSILPTKSSQFVIDCANKHFQYVRADTCTADNGIENTRHEKSTVPVYFCDKGAPWQKPHVEGGIGLIRRWFLPKGTNLDLIDDRVFQSQLHLLNGKYRKSLNYESAYEQALKSGIIKKIPKVSLKAAIAFR